MRSLTQLPARISFFSLLAPAILVAASGIAGCAAPRGLLVPVQARAPGTSKVEMIVATTRERTDPGEMPRFLVVREEFQTRAKSLNQRNAPRTTRNQSGNKSESNRRHTSTANDFADLARKINSQEIVIRLPRTLQFIRRIFAPLVSQTNALGILHGQLFSWGICVHSFHNPHDFDGPLRSRQGGVFRL
jgi:hypothetical protein